MDSCAKTCKYRSTASPTSPWQILYMNANSSKCLFVIFRQRRKDVKEQIRMKTIAQTFKRLPHFFYSESMQFLELEQENSKITTFFFSLRKKTANLRCASALKKNLANFKTTVPKKGRGETPKKNSQKNIGEFHQSVSQSLPWRTSKASLKEEKEEKIWLRETEVKK